MRHKYRDQLPKNACVADGFPPSHYPMIRGFRRLVLVTATVLVCAPASYADDTITSINVTGSQRIEPSAVISYSGLKSGQVASQYDLDEGMKRIYETGFYSDVSLDNNSGSLTILVKENPSISQVIFEGNDKISKDDLEKEITLKSRSIYTRSKVQNDLKRLLDVYRRGGRYSAEITPQIIPLEQNRVNLIYNIVEGPKALIEKITFIGNSNFDNSTLEHAINSRQERWWQFLTDSDKYDPDRLNYDQELLRKFYFQKGYADFKVKSAIAELSPQRDAFYLTFTVEEGPRYKFGRIDVTTTLPKGRVPDLAPSILTHEGEIYNATDVEDSINRMTDVLGDAGFAFVEITPKTVRRPGNEKIIDLTYAIAEGPKVYIDRINIFGNIRTLDEVIRREFKLAEGDAFSTSKMKRTEQRLNNLGFFEKVDIQRKPGAAADLTNLDVEVKEKSTGEITLGAGFSTVDGPLLDMGLRERNFLGQGQDFRARALLGGRRKNFDLGVTEPYFLGRQLEAGFNLFKTAQNYQNNAAFDRESLGGVVHLGYNISERFKHQLRYTFEETEISNVASNASQYIVQQQGRNANSILGHSLIYDTRDNRNNPTSGYSIRFNQDFAGLGGDNTFIRHEIRSDYYLPLAKKWTYAAFLLGGNITGIGEDVRINNRFFIGSQEVRGFANAGIGPRDLTTNDALGGDTYYAVSNEVRFPLGLGDDLGLTGAAFVDFANLYGIGGASTGVGDNNALRASAGVGVAWSSPFGLIRVDFAQAFLKQDYDDTEIVRFRFGTSF